MPAGGTSKVLTHCVLFGSNIKVPVLTGLSTFFDHYPVECSLRWPYLMMSSSHRQCCIEILSMAHDFQRINEVQRKRKSQSRDICRLLSRCKTYFLMTHRDHLFRTRIKLQALCSAHSQNLWLNYEKKTYLFWDITTSV